MSIFGKIAAAIFGGPAAAAPVTEQTAAGAPRLPDAVTSAPPTSSTTPPTPAMPGQAPAAPAPGAAPVDVTAILDRITADKDGSLGDIDWRKSIVDLMKLLELDSSLKSRKDLAQELGYSGDMGDSAKMNVWLHKQVITKLQASGGRVPADLKKS